MLKTVPELIADTTAHVRTLDATEARKERKEARGFLIDVRESGEAEKTPSVASQNIPRGVLEMQITALCPDENRAIYLHCASGGRARLAADQLLKMGYRNVTAISCGIDQVLEVFDND